MEELFSLSATCNSRASNEETERSFTDLNKLQLGRLVTRLLEDSEHGSWIFTVARS